MARKGRVAGKQDSEPQQFDELDAFRFQLFVAGSVTCGKGWRLDAIEQPQHRLIVIRGGSGHLILRDKRLPLRRGHVIFGLPGDYYGIEQHPQRRLVDSIVRFDVFDSSGKQVVLPAAFRPALYTEVKCFPLLEELMMRLTSAVPAMPCWATGLTVSLLRSALWLIREDHHSVDSPFHAMNLAGESLRPFADYKPPVGQREPSTRELARLCGMSVSTFSRRMRLRHGLSPKKLLIQRRIERAKVLLLESNYTVEAIAAELGYKEPGHFTRQFKKWVGVSPSSFRTSDR